jgi:hypothetical protein
MIMWRWLSLESPAGLMRLMMEVEGDETPASPLCMARMTDETSMSLEVRSKASGGLFAREDRGKLGDRNGRLGDSDG